MADHARAARVLRLAAGAVLVTALVGFAWRGSVGRALEGSALVLLVATPVLRVVALGAGWWRARDLRFAFLALALVLVVASGPLLALATR